MREGGRQTPKGIWFADKWKSKCNHAPLCGKRHPCPRYRPLRRSRSGKRTSHRRDGDVSGTGRRYGYARERLQHNNNRAPAAVTGRRRGKSGITRESPSFHPVGKREQDSNTPTHKRQQKKATRSKRRSHSNTSIVNRETERCTNGHACTHGPQHGGTLLPWFVQ